MEPTASVDHAAGGVGTNCYGPYKEKETFRLREADATIFSALVLMSDWSIKIGNVLRTLIRRSGCYTDSGKLPRKLVASNFNREYEIIL